MIVTVSDIRQAPLAPRLRRKRQQMLKHGKNLARAYMDALLKRFKQHGK